MSSTTATSSCVEEPQPELHSRLEAYTLKYKLGEGGFGKVYLAETVIDGERALVAIKAVQRVTRAGRMKSEVLSAEKRLMQLLSTEDEHGSFPHLIETFEDKHNAYFVSEYIPGSTLLEEINRSGGRIGQDRARFILAQLLVAVNQLHKAQWMHRDIKPDNILLDAAGNVLLTDFGLAYDFSSESVTDRPLGTPGFRAPQIDKNEPYSSKADIYSLGCLFSLMVYGKLPSECKIDPFRNYLVNDLLLNMLQEDESRRPSAAECMKYPFFRDTRWSSFEKRKCVLPCAWAPPVLVPDSAAVISKDVLLNELAFLSNDSPEAFAVPLVAPKVKRPEILRERYKVQVSLRRGSGGRAHLLVSSWSVLRALRVDPREALGLRRSVGISSIVNAPVPAAHLPSPPPSPPPRTPSPVRAPAPPPRRPTFAFKPTFVPYRAVPSYSHCFC